MALLAVVACLLIVFKSRQTLASVDLPCSSDVISSVHFASLPHDHLLKENLVDLDVAVIHHEVLGHEVLEHGTVDDVELRVALQTADEVVDSLLVLVPVLFVLLDFVLRTTQVFIELLEVVVVVNLLKLVLRSDLLQVVEDLLAELAGLL